MVTKGHSLELQTLPPAFVSASTAVLGFIGLCR